jgi:hypothetical protein
MPLALAEPARLADRSFTNLDGSSGYSLVTLPSNVGAIETGQLFSTGVIPFAAFVGPSGWGKTHLLVELASSLGSTVRPLALQVFLRQPHRYESSRTLILDDVQEAIGKTRCRQELGMHLERRIRAGRRTALAFTAAGPSRTIRALLPQVREWSVCSMSAPSKDERVFLVGQLAAQHKLCLSSELARVMGAKMGGNGRTLIGALQCLHLIGNSWSTPEQTLRACGILDPFFADNGDWDLKIKIRRLATSRSGVIPGVDPLDLALHTALCVAGLGEADTARSASVEPAEAYARVSRLQRKMREDPSVLAACKAFVGNVVESLA